MTNQKANKALQDRRRRKRTERIATVVALIVMIGAWIYGYLNSGSEVRPLVANVLPAAERIEQRGDVFIGYHADEVVGYAGSSEASGYGGPVEILVGIDTTGRIQGVQVVEHRETPGFFRQLSEENFLGQFLGMSYQESLIVGEGIDAASGATVSSEAVARALHKEVNALARGPLGAEIQTEAESISIGIPEIVLVGLFVSGYFGHRTRNRGAKKWIRRATLITGAVVLGFIYNKPLTIANITSLLAGYWPSWQNHVYWFLLLGGILFVTSAQGKNPYCSWFCPFGAVQEGLGNLGGAKLVRPRRLHRLLKWTQRGLAFGAITLGLAFRQPGIVSYEPFGTLFDFTGNWPQWILLALVLLGSLVMYRPFCTYLCPLDPVVDYIGEIRRWGQGIWREARR